MGQPPVEWVVQCVIGGAGQCQQPAADFST